MQIALDTAGAARHPLAWMRNMLTAPPAAVVAAEPAPQRPVSLARGETMVVEHAQGRGLICTDGALWITHDHDPQDRIVEGGGRYLVAGPERMLVHALSQATVQFFDV